MTWMINVKWYMPAWSQQLLSMAHICLEVMLRSFADCTSYTKCSRQSSEATSRSFLETPFCLATSKAAPEAVATCRHVAGTPSSPNLVEGTDCILCKTIQKAKINKHHESTQPFYDWFCGLKNVFSDFPHQNQSFSGPVQIHQFHHFCLRLPAEKGRVTWERCSLKALQQVRFLQI